MKKDNEYYEGLDKRTKEYKEWAKFNRIGNDVEYTPEGLGTNIEKVLKVTGVKKVIDSVFDDCGCQDRLDNLNDPLIKQKRPPLRCLTESQYNDYQEYKTNRTLNVWKENEIELLINLYAHVFALQYNNKDLCRNCSGSGKILFRMSKELDVVYESYKKDIK